MEPLGRGLTAPSVIELAADEGLLAGLVDAHVHVNEPGRTEWEGFASATPGRGRRRGDHDHRHAAQQHRNISPYQGLALAGVVRRTFLRGREVDGSTHGRLLRRGID